jgi:hypothetical protein
VINCCVESPAPTVYNAAQKAFNGTIAVLEPSKICYCYEVRHVAVRGHSRSIIRSPASRPPGVRRRINAALTSKDKGKWLFTDKHEAVSDNHVACDGLQTGCS